MSAILLLIVASITALSHIAVQAQPEPLRCEFETKIKTGSKSATVHKWEFYRGSNVVAHLRADRSDIWTLMGKQAALEQWFHEHRVILESAPGDLRAAGTERKWNALAEIVDDKLLAKLRRKGAKTISAYKAERYVGKVEETDWEIWWIPELRLAAKIVQTRGKEKTETVLKRVDHRPLELQASGYRRIDYADLGDLESDPVVKMVLRETQQHRH